MVSYSHIQTDPLGCTHSVDKLLVEFFVKSYSSFSVLDALSEIFERHDATWSREKCRKDLLPACSRYAWFSSSIWCNGIYIRYGHYRRLDRTGKKPEWDIVPLLRMEFNPNKHWDLPVFRALREWLARECDNGVVVRFDYAVDIPCKLSDIAVHSRKEPGLYKGTRYFGQRNHSGRLKVYDKKQESSLDQTLSRVEWTFAYDKPLSFDRVVWLTRGPQPLPDVSELGSQSYALARMILTIRSLGGDVQEALSLLSYRTQKKLEPYTIGSGVQLLGSDGLYALELLAFYCSALSLSYRSGGVNPVSIGSGSRQSWDELDNDDDDGLPF